MNKKQCLVVVLGLCVASGFAFADQAAPLSALAKMPVKEITIFKDGHAFVLHEGAMPTDTTGNVQLDYLPTPVLGTFWPYSADKNVKLTAVTASQRRVLVIRTALSLREFLEANPGVEVGITQVDGKGYGAKIIGVPARSSEELEATNPPNTDPRLPEKGNVILLKTVEGVSVVNLDRIQDVTFKDDYKTSLAQEEFRNLLTLKLDWTNGRPGSNVNVGMIYLQKGVRWIPNYKITLDGKGNAVVKLQATLINEMTDLENVTAHLVIGVPSFAFKDIPDPISLQRAFGPLSQYFQTDSRTGYAFSNAIMTQAAGGGGFGGGGGGGGFGGFGGYGGEAGPGVRGDIGRDLGPEITGSEREEDLFIFTLKNVTLKKGQRMVFPVAEYTLKYKDVYTLNLPILPPREIRANVSSQQQAELMRQLAAPKFTHKIRVTNITNHPFTTAPALIISGDRVLGQGMMTYTASGADVDLRITEAPDIKVKRTEKESGRKPRDLEWNGEYYNRVELAGTLSITNYRDEAVDLEITRYVVGRVGTVDHDGKAEMINWMDEGEFIPYDYPYWWYWYDWPYWWQALNGVGRFTWNLRLNAGQSVDLNYTWHYFWR